MAVALHVCASRGTYGQGQIRTVAPKWTGKEELAHESIFLTFELPLEAEPVACVEVGVLDKGQVSSYDEIDLSSNSVRADTIIFFLQFVPDDRHR